LSFLSFCVIQQYQLILNELICFWFQTQAECPHGCICGQPSNWKTEELKLNCLREVEIREFRGSDNELVFVKRLFTWATGLKRIAVAFNIQLLKARPRSCARCCEPSPGQKYAWTFMCIRTRLRCCMHLKTKVLLQVLGIFSFFFSFLYGMYSECLRTSKCYRILINC
jgi:hypothetical protein